jgi:4-amino-4-deoxy-L-arabinose transferase-like glycosyltransferase
MSTATLEPGRARLSPDGASRRSTGRGASWLPVALPCLLAAALVLLELGTRSLWLDEAATVAIAGQHGGALWSAIAHDGGNMLGYYLLLHVLTGWFGHAPAVIRAPSALSTVATVAIVTLIARRLFGGRTALAAGVLTTVSLPLIFWGQDARGYAPLLTAIAGSFLALIELGHRPRSRGAAMAYAATIVAAMYMSFVAALAVAAQLIWLLWRPAPPLRPRRRTLVTALGAAAVACLPIAVLALRRGSGQLSWVPAPNISQIGDVTRWVTSAGLPPNFHRTATSTLLLVLSLTLLAAALVAAVRERRRGPGGPLLLVCWLVFPLALSLLESVAGQPIQLARNSLVALPAASLLLAWALTQRRVPAPLGLTLLAVLVVLRSLQLAPSYGASPEDWRSATGYVVAAATNGDCIAFYPSDGRMAFDLYRGAGAVPAPRPVLPSAPWGQLKPYIENYATVGDSRLARIAAACPRVWLLASHEGMRSGPPASRANLARYRSLQTSLRKRYRTDSGEKKFGWADPVRVELFGG